MMQQTPIIATPRPIIQLDETRILGGIADGSTKVAAGSKTVPPPD